VSYRACRVFYPEGDGTYRSAHVDAETAYEAAALAIKQWSMSNQRRGPDKQAILTIVVEGGQTYRVLTQKVMEWLYSRPAKTPDEAERVKRLRLLLAEERR
jgi:hypothetical protein